MQLSDRGRSLRAGPGGGRFERPISGRTEIDRIRIYNLFMAYLKQDLLSETGCFCFVYVLDGLCHRYSE
jgi:hypothetical protein